MRVRSLRLLTTFLALLLGIGIPSARATSLGKSAARSTSACAIAVKFRETKAVDGKVFWVFDPLPSARPSAGCAGLARAFEVYVPSGAYSRAENAYVYPISIVAPNPGEEVALRLESVRFKSGETRWLVAGDGDAFRVIR